MITCPGKYITVWLKYNMQEKRDKERERRIVGLNLSFSSPKYVQSMVPK
jgi:hypothetical protein